jgi:hypothetical protein
MLDFNRANISGTPLSVGINALIEAAEPLEPNTRKYLGASVIGSECLRRIQYDWVGRPAVPHTDPRYFCARALLRGSQSATSDPCWLSFRASGGAQLCCRRWAVSRSCRRYSCCRTQSVRNGLPGYLGTQSTRRKGLACRRARRARTRLSTICRANLALSGLFGSDDVAGAIHRDERRHLRTTASTAAF